jgi:hypothetical protein
MPAINWTQLLNVSNVGGVLTKTGGANDTPNAGAVSADVLSGDGSYEFTIDHSNDYYIGLDPSATLVTDYTQLNYLFLCVQGGSVSFRENGVYQGESVFDPGTVAKFDRSSGVIKFYLDNVLVYTSPTPLVGDARLHALLLDIGTSISNGTITGGGSSIPTLPIPSAIAQTGAPTTYPTAITDRNQRIPPSVFVPPARGEVYVDALFGNRPIVRGSDGTVGPANLIGKSHRIGSSSSSCIWSRDSSQIWGTTPSGAITLWAVDLSTNSATRARLTFLRVLDFTNEPTFSRVTAGRMFGGMGTKVKEHNTQTNTYTDVADIAILDPSAVPDPPLGLVLGGTVQSSMSNPERIAVFYGGQAQDAHFRCMIFDKNNTANKLILDTLDRTINGVSVPGMDAFHIHSIGLSYSGRYVMLSTTSEDETADPSGNSLIHVWDTALGTVTEVTDGMFPWGHGVMGWNDWVNNDAGGDSPYDAFQWRYRQLSDLANPALVINPKIGPPHMVYQDTHSTWANAQSNVVVPFLMVSYRYNEDIPENLDLLGNRDNTVAYRAGDNEIAFIHPVTGALERVCHHLSNIYGDDGNNGGTAFWYQPQGHQSPNGRLIVYHSNKLKTLGVDVTGDPTTAYRSDLWVVDMDWVLEGEEPPPDPEVTPGDILNLQIGRTSEQSLEIDKRDKMNIELFKGATKRLIVTVKGGGITGWAIEAKVRNSKGELVATIPCPVQSDTVFWLTFTSTISSGFATEEHSLDAWRTDAGSEEPLVVPSRLAVLSSVRFPA